MIDQVAVALDQLSRRNGWTGEEDLVFVNPTGEHIEDSALRRRFYAALKADAAEKLSAALREASTGPPVPSARPAA